MSALPATSFRTLAETLRRFVEQGGIDHASKHMRYSDTQAEFAKTKMREITIWLDALAGDEAQIRAALSRKQV